VSLGLTAQGVFAVYEVARAPACVTPNSATAFVEASHLPLRLMRPTEQRNVDLPRTERFSPKARGDGTLGVQRSTTRSWWRHRA
jgi:hypothetical protein